MEITTENDIKNIKTIFLIFLAISLFISGAFIYRADKITKEYNKLAKEYNECLENHTIIVKEDQEKLIGFDFETILQN